MYRFIYSVPRRSKRLAAKKLRDLQKPKTPVIVPKPSTRSKKVKAKKNRKPSRRPKALRLRPPQPYRKHVKRGCLWSLFTPCHKTPGPDFETRWYSSKQHTAVCKGKEIFIQKLTQIVSGEAHQFDFYDRTFGDANLGQQYVDDEVAERILILQGAWLSYRANTVARMISMGKIPDVRKGIKLKEHFEHKIRKMSLFHQQRYLHWRLTMKGRQMDIKRNTANNLKSVCCGQISI